MNTNVRVSRLFNPHAESIDYPGRSSLCEISLSYLVAGIHKGLRLRTYCQRSPYRDSLLGVSSWRVPDFSPVVLLSSLLCPFQGFQVRISNRLKMRRVSALIYSRYRYSIITLSLLYRYSIDTLHIWAPP